MIRIEKQGKEFAWENTCSQLRLKNLRNELQEVLEEYNRLLQFVLSLDFQENTKTTDTEDHSKPVEEGAAVDIKTMKWRVENSWGDEKDKPGYLMMTDSWYSEYVYEVVIDKKYVPDDVLGVLQQEPVVLPAWDPMGSLACVSCDNEVQISHL